MQVRFGSVDIRHIRRGAVLTDEQTESLDLPVVLDAMAFTDEVRRSDAFAYSQEREGREPFRSAHKGTTRIAVKEPSPDRRFVSFTYLQKREDGTFIPVDFTAILPPGSDELSGLNLKTPAPADNTGRISPLPGLILDTRDGIFEKKQPTAEPPGKNRPTWPAILRRLLPGIFH